MDPYQKLFLNCSRLSKCLTQGGLLSRCSTFTSKYRCNDPCTEIRPYCKRQIIFYLRMKVDTCIKRNIPIRYKASFQDYKKFRAGEMAGRCSILDKEM